MCKVDFLVVKSDLFRNELSRSVVRVVEERCRKMAKAAIVIVNFS